MPEQEVARDQWEHFFDRLSLMRHGWYVTLEEMPTEEAQANPILEDADMQAPGGEVRLQEIRLEETDGQARITLDAGEQPQGFQHVVEQPVAVGYEVTDDKNDVEIAIDNEAGLTTIIHLRNPILPQTMRGDLEPEMRKDNPDPDDLGEL